MTTGAGVGATISGLKGVSDWWRLRTTDSVPIDEAVATSGSVQVHGHVRPVQSGNTFMSPVRNKKCVACEYIIDYQIEDAGDAHIDSGIEYGPFVIADGTAEISLILPRTIFH
jgi:hypothetical protein